MQTTSEICKRIRQCLWDSARKVISQGSVSQQILQVDSASSEDLDSLLVAHRHNIVRATYARKLAAKVAKQEDLVLDKVLLLREYDFVQGQVTAKYRSNNIFFDIDCSIWSAAERRLLLDVIRHLCSHRHVLGGRHVIVLHNVHTLNHALLQSLKKILENAKAQAVFICTSKTTATNVSLHAGMCVPIRCDEPGLLVQVIVGVNLVDAEQALVRHHRDLMNACFDLHCCNGYSNAIDVRARAMVCQLRQFRAQKTSVKTVIDTLEKWSSEIVAAALPFDALLHSIVRACASVTDDAGMVNIVELCACAEHRYLKANKVTPVVDHFLWNLYHNLTPSTE
jgi:hypothetical protein